MIAAALVAGRYAAFIWPAYGVSVLVFAWMIADTLARARRWRREVERLEEEREDAPDLPPDPRRTRA